MRTLLPIFLLLFAAPALAHKPSDSYLTLTPIANRVMVRWDIALRDLEDAMGLDTNGNGEITWGEVRRRHAAIAAYALPRLQIRANDVCTPSPLDHKVDEHTDGAYAVLQFEATCPGTPDAIEVDYQLLFDINPQHRGLLRLELPDQAQTRIFAPEQPSHRIALRASSPFRSLLDFGKEGVFHILYGFDHLLFLLTLLLPSVLYREGRRWHVEDRFQDILWNVLKVVTAFTVAHSITLSLAVFEVVQLPSRWVEAIIALSIIVAAVDNLYPIFFGRRWVFAFSFGLIHGFGFAGALLDFGLSENALLFALGGFNLGVEAGQLAMVALFLPLAYRLRRSFLYRPPAMAAASVFIIGLASIWFIERAFNLRLLS